jgi:hypothetical protein
VAALGARLGDADDAGDAETLGVGAMAVGAALTEAEGVCLSATFRGGSLIKG